MIPLGFLSPWTLAFGLGIPLLVLAYLRRQQTKRYVVSSVLVLKTLSRRSAPRRRFLPPLRFFLELFALAALVFAAAEPLFDTHGDRIAILLDNSFSMRATMASGGTDTRFESAKNETRTWMSKQNAASRYSLFVPSPRLQLAGHEDVLRDAVNRDLEAIEPTYAPDALEGSAAELVSSEKYDKIFIVSDKGVELEKDVKGVETKTVGALRQNLAVNSLRVEQSESIGGRSRLLAGIAYAGDGSGSLPVKLSYLSADGKEEVVQSVQVAVRPDGIAEAAFELPQEARAPGFWRVSVETGKGDSLREDNSAFIATSNQEQAGVLLVSEGTGGTYGLDRIGELSVASVTPEAYSKLSPEQLRQFRLLVFHGTAPVAFPEQPMLVIVPPAGNPLFPAKEEARAPRISSWVSEHPITSYLRVPLLVPPASVIFAENALAKPVIRAETGAVLLAGEGRGVRYAAVGFEILPFEGAATPVPSVLTLNLLSWLRGGLEIGGERRTGGMMPMAAGKEWRVRALGAPNGAPAPEVKGSTLELKTPGAYVLEEKSGKEPRQLFGVNLFHPEESNTFALQTVALSGGVEREASETIHGLPLWTYAVWAALAAIVLECLLALRKPSERTA